jgi:branched-chain amino acid transport system substrate-binding protein
MVMQGIARIFLSLLAVAACAHAQAQAGDPYKLGFLMPLTGGPGKMGNMMMEGSTLAVEEINAAGGIGGRRLVLVPEDSQGLAKQGLDGFRKLIDVDHADVIITGYTAVVSAVAPQATQSKAYLISGSTASSAVRAVSPYFQNTWTYEEDQVGLILGYAKTHLKVQRLAVMTVISDLGTNLGAAVKKEWAAAGGVLAAEETHQQTESNFRSTMLKMLTSRPDAIYLTTSNDKQASQIVRQARELGYKGVFLSFGALEGPEMLTIGKQADGSYFTSAAYDPAGNNPATKRFVESFSKRYAGRTPNIHHANHYDLVYMYKAAAEVLVKKNSPVNGANVRETFMTNLAEYRGVAGTYRFNFKEGSARRSAIIKTIADGKFVKVADLE